MPLTPKAYDSPKSPRTFWKPINSYPCVIYRRVGLLPCSKNLPILQPCVTCSKVFFTNSNPTAANRKHTKRPFVDSDFGARISDFEHLPSPPQILYDRFGARMHMQFLVNCPHVTPHGVDADVHAIGNFLVGVTVGQLLKK